MIDWTINIGTLLQVVAFVIAAAGAFFTLRADIRVLRHDVRGIQQEIITLGENSKQISHALTTLAVQQSRLDRAEEMINELRHGQGFVNPMRS